MSTHLQELSTQWKFRPQELRLEIPKLARRGFVVKGVDQQASLIQYSCRFVDYIYKEEEGFISDECEIAGVQKALSVHHSCKLQDKGWKSYSRARRPGGAVDGDILGHANQLVLKHLL